MVSDGRVAGHAYPWDVLGDPHFAERAHDIGVDTVTLAASYHSTRAATPLHPRHQTVNAEHAALYRPVRAAAWKGRRLVPGSPEWTDEPDAFGTAARILREAGLRVAAWIVLTHSSRLGAANPDVANDAQEPPASCRPGLPGTVGVHGCGRSAHPMGHVGALGLST